MKKITIVHEFEFTVTSLVKTREARYNHPELFPEVERVEEVKLDTINGVINRVRNIYMKNNLPSAVGKAFKTNTLMAVEETWQPEDFSSLKVIAIMDLFNGNIRFYEESYYEAVDDNTSKRTISVEATCNIPLIGKMVENVLVAEFRKRSDDDCNTIINLKNEENF